MIAGALPDALHATVRGWINHVRYANTLGLRKAVLGRARPDGATRQSHHQAGGTP